MLAPVEGRSRTRVILLPGAVLPADLAYASLLAELEPSVEARMKDLDVYATAEPPASFGLDDEVDGVLRLADGAGFERFHLVGYSAGGAIALAVAARHPERVQSLALLEPAWAGNHGLAAEEAAEWRRLDEMMRLPPPDLMREFTRAQLRPGVAPPPPPEGPPPPWMRSRPGGLAALGRAFARYDLDTASLRAFAGPVLYVLGTLSNPSAYRARADRLAELFGDFDLEVFEDRHHFDPPHRAEPARLAASLQRYWHEAA